MAYTPKATTTQWSDGEWLVTAHMSLGNAYSMRPAAARALAAELVERADEAERLEAERDV